MQINNLPSDVGLDEKNNRLAILVDGFGWVYVPWQESQFRVVWEKYLEARRAMKGEEVLEDFILQEPQYEAVHGTPFDVRIPRPTGSVVIPDTVSIEDFILNTTDHD